MQRWLNHPARTSPSSISFDVPASPDDQVRGEFAVLDGILEEAEMVGLDRHGRITHHQIGLPLRLERHETDGLLKRHEVVEDFPRAEELVDEIATRCRLIEG